MPSTVLAEDRAKTGGTWPGGEGAEGSEVCSFFLEKLSRYVAKGRGCMGYGAYDESVILPMEQ